MNTDAETTGANAAILDALPRPFVEGHPEYTELYDFAWRLAVEKIRETRGIRHMDTAWIAHKNFQWVWDLSFIGIYCRYAADRVPALGAYDLFYKFQREDGYISMCYDFTTGDEPWASGEPPERINPPLFAWGEWEYYRTTGDASRLATSVGHIERLMDWIDANRRTVLGSGRKFINEKHREQADPGEYLLYWFKDGGSSGMDNSPRTPRNPAVGSSYAWIDLSAQMALSFRCLAAIHDVLGNRERAAYWTMRAAALADLINRELWCERTRFYYDKSIPDNFVAHKTAASFWPILAGICTGERLAAMVSHLLDPREFNRPVPVPVLSADDPNYVPEGLYMCSGVWASTNYMIIRGLMQAGEGQVAHDLAVRYLDALHKTYVGVEPHTLWECYSPEYPQPGIHAYNLERVKPHFVGWTGIGPIAMLIENVLGLDWDAPARRLTWDVRLTAEHGIRRFRLASGAYADLVCRRRPTPESTPGIEVVSDTAFDLVIRCAGRTSTTGIPAGRRTVVK